MFATLLLACGTPAETASEGPTWYGDVAPIVASHCDRCHSTGLAPELGDAATVADKAALIAARVEEGSMPPPAPDPECRPYGGADALVLDDEERATILAWAEAGAPLGDAVTEPEGSDPFAQDWDVELMAGQDYAPEFGEDGNDYRCFALQLDAAEDLWVDGFGAIVDNRSIVHHVVIYSVEEDQPLDDDPAGFSCNGLGEDGWDFLAGWAPGGGPVGFAAGQAMKLDAGQRFVLQMHYFGDATRSGEVDRSGFGLSLHEGDVEHGVLVYPLGPTSFTIPADDPEYTRRQGVTWPDGYGTLNVVGVFPHMHLLGRAFSMEAGPDDAETCLVEADPWDFHNQVAVLFDEPLPVAAGDRIRVACTWDNSATSPYQFNDPPQDIGFGEDSTDEMCFAFTYGYLD